MKCFKILWTRIKSWMKNVFQPRSLPPTSKLKLELVPPPRKAQPPDLGKYRSTELSVNVLGHLVGEGCVNGVKE